jgi:pimeloyl-ACP methyl ester carboxylesterase
MRPPAPIARHATLADGSLVGYHEYGDPGGTPVLALHGVPASGAGFGWADAAARSRHVRLVAPDRPGIGASTRRRGLAVAEHAAVLEAFADAIGLRRFAVLGYSGGGPHAVAAAARLGDRVTATVVASSMGEIGTDATIEDFAATDARFLRLAPRRPHLAAAVLRLASVAVRLAPAAAMREARKELGAADSLALDALGDARSFTTLLVDAVRGGAHGVVDDHATLARPWEVDAATITSPVTILHGDGDALVPLRHAEALHARIAGSRLWVVPGEGHLATITHIGEVLELLTDRRTSHA